MRSSFAWAPPGAHLVGGGVGPRPAGRLGSGYDSETGVSAVEPEAEPPRRSLVKWNEYEGPLFTLRVGAGFLLDYAAYAQDDASREQMDLSPGSRSVTPASCSADASRPSGGLPSAGVMYDGNLEEWFIRQTGLMIAVPEAWGNFWIGRSKEGPASTG